jgi:hypothetical protein
MAIDPTALADEQAQREGINRIGQPTEIAGGPEQYVQLAGPLGSFFDLLRAAGRGSAPGEPATRVPTPQELPLREGEVVSEIQSRLAPEILSPQGVQRFEDARMQAPAPGQFGAGQQDADVLGAGRAALDEVPPVADDLTPSQPESVLQSAEGALQQDAQAASSAAARIDAETSQPLGQPVRQPEITDEVAARVAAAAADPDAPLKSLLDGGDFNFDYIQAPEDVGRVITELGEVFADETVAATRGVISNNVTLEEAAKIAADELGLTRRLLSRRIGEGAINASEMVAARELLVRSTRRITQLAQEVSSGTADAATQLNFRRQLAIHAAIQMQVKGMQTEVARALQSFRIPVTGEMDVNRINAAAQEFLESGGYEASTRAFADRIAKIGELPEGQRSAAINEMISQGWWGRTKEIIGEAYLNGLLSSPHTQAKNILGNASFMLFQLPSEIIGGAYGAAIRGGSKIIAPNRAIPEDQAYIENAFIRIRGWADSYRDALRAGARAFSTEVPASFATKIDAPVGAIRSSQDNFFGRAINELGRRGRYPFRFLMFGDEFFKTISQRGDLYVRSYQRYQASIRAGNDAQTAIDDAGMLLLDPTAASKELNLQARYDTLTSDLGAFGKLARRVQDTIPGRYLLPFFTAPTNEFLRTLETIPGPWSSKVVGDLIGNNGPRAQQLALGRWTMGGATLFTVSQYAQEGRLTGSMPSDQGARDALPPGWQPYSLVIRGEGFPKDEEGEFMPLYDAFGRPNGPLSYVNYAGFGPVSGVIGIGADVTQRLYSTRSPQAGSNIISAAVAATARYYLELPMLQGVSEVVNFLEASARGDTTSIEGLMRGPAEASTPVGFPSPVSSLQRNIMRSIDPTRVAPRGDIEYLTMDDVMEGFQSGRTGFANPDGTPNYRLVGQPRGDLGAAMREIFNSIDAYQSRDSILREEMDLNVLRYDVLGNVLGEGDISFATAPGLATWNLMTGMRIRQGETPTPLQDELMRLSVITNGSPLSNPDRRGGVSLSTGAQSDLIRIAKNEMTLRQPGIGETDFRGALDNLITTNAYIRATDPERRSMIQSVQDQYVEAGFAILLQLPEYANLRQAIEDRRRLEEQGLR